MKNANNFYTWSFISRGYEIQLYYCDCGAAIQSAEDSQITNAPPRWQNALSLSHLVVEFSLLTVAHMSLFAQLTI